MYSGYFNVVTAVPMRALLTDDAFCAALHLEQHAGGTPVDTTRSDEVKWNTSYSKQALDLTLWREHFPNRFGMRSPSYVDVLEADIDRVLSAHGAESQIEQKEVGSVALYNRGANPRTRRLLSPFTRRMQWRWLMQSALPPLVSVEPFILNSNVEADFPGLPRSQDLVRILQKKA